MAGVALLTGQAHAGDVIGAIEQIKKETSGDITIQGFACEVGVKNPPLIYIGHAGAKYDIIGSLVFKDNYAFYNNSAPVTPSLDSNDLYAGCNLSFNPSEPKIKYRFRVTVPKAEAMATGQHTVYLMTYGSDNQAKMVHVPNFSQRIPYLGHVGQLQSVAHRLTLDKTEVTGVANDVAGDVLITGKICYPDNKELTPNFQVRVANQISKVQTFLKKDIDYTLKLNLPTPNFCGLGSTSAKGFELRINSHSQILRDPADPRQANPAFAGSQFWISLVSPTAGVDLGISGQLPMFIPKLVVPKPVLAQAGASCEDKSCIWFTGAAVPRNFMVDIRGANGGDVLASIPADKISKAFYLNPQFLRGSFKVPENLLTQFRTEGLRIWIVNPSVGSWSDAGLLVKP